jgi:NAD(P)-dependent dehydrogenase (short-subunit alcohol dehydrogenase family)
VRAQKSWLITGSGGGLGLEIARAALEVGDRVVAAARRIDSLADLERDFGSAITPVRLDVTNPAEVAAAVRAAGIVDVVVNNAGHGYLAAVEEGEEDKIRQTFEVNFFGAAAIIRAVLPGMRERGDGTIVNISSVAGFSAGAGSAYYAASKYALEGLSDALIAEAGPLGVRVLIVEPGPIRTAFASTALLSSPALPAYAATAGKRQQAIKAADGKQAGDPVAIARLLVDLVHDGTPASRVVLGRMAFAGVRQKVASVLDDLATLEARGLATDYPDRPQR